MVTLAFSGLVITITFVCVLLFKELSQIDGEYLYNPASALCMAEIGKFLVSCCVRIGTKQLITHHFCPSPCRWSYPGRRRD